MTSNNIEWYVTRMTNVQLEMAISSAYYRLKQEGRRSDLAVLWGEFDRRVAEGLILEDPEEFTSWIEGEG